MLLHKKTNTEKIERLVVRNLDSIVSRTQKGLKKIIFT